MLVDADGSLHVHLEPAWCIQSLRHLSLNALTETPLTCVQGDVYDKVIKVVCEQSQVDFEEGGVDESTLKLLKSVWLHYSLLASLIMFFSLVINVIVRTASYRNKVEHVAARSRARFVEGGDHVDFCVGRAGQGRNLFLGGSPPYHSFLYLQVPNLHQSTLRRLRLCWSTCRFSRLRSCCDARSLTTLLSHTLQY